MTILISIFLLGFAYLAAKRLEWALMLLFFLLPSYLIRFKAGVPMTLLEAMILIVASSWAWQNRGELIDGIRRTSKLGLDNRKRVAYPFGVEAVLALVVALVAVGVSGWSVQAFGIWKAYFFEPALLYLVTVNVIGRSERPLGKKLALVIWPLALSALAVSLFAAYQKITGQFIANPMWAAPATRRAVSFFGYPNAVGLYVESIIFLALGLFIFARQCAGRICFRNRLILLLTVGLSLFAIVFAKSVGAALGVAAGFSAFALLYSRASRRAALVLLGLGLLAAALVQPLRHEALEYATLNDFSGQVRRSQWRETWAMLKDDGRWLWGSGLSSYQAAVKPYHKDGIFIEDYDDPDSHRKLVFNADYRTAHWQPLEIYMYPHNIVLNFWTELGLAGLLLFAWIIAKYFRIWILEFRIWKNRIELPLLVGLAAAMVALLVHGLVDVPYFKNDLSAIFWLLLALLSIIRLERLAKQP